MSLNTEITSLIRQRQYHLAEDRIDQTSLDKISDYIKLIFAVLTDIPGVDDKEEFKVRLLGKIQALDEDGNCYRMIHDYVTNILSDFHPGLTMYILEQYNKKMGS